MDDHTFAFNNHDSFSDYDTFYYQNMSSWPMSFEQSMPPVADDSNPTAHHDSNTMGHVSLSQHPSLQYGQQQQGQQQQQHQHAARNDMSGAGWAFNNVAQQYSRQFQHQGQLHPSPMDFPAPPQSLPLNPGMSMATTSDAAFIPYSTSIDAYGPLVSYHNDLHNGLVGYPVAHQHRFQQHAFPHQLMGTSPPDNSTVDVGSSSGSECGWQMVDYGDRQSFESSGFPDMHNSTAVSNPGLTLHIRTCSDSSHNGEHPGSAESVQSLDSFEDVGFPGSSPRSDLATLEGRPIPQTGFHSHDSAHSPHNASCSSPSSTSTSPTSPASGSPTSRRKKNPLAKASKSVIKKSTPPMKKTASGEPKRVGRRRGPLRPEQRISAGEIRKLRACLRCKFLKKTCDKGDPCAGCQPSHARLWQVPCTRIDIKDIGYFLKDWKADYERHLTLGFSVANIYGYASKEQQLYITHGFGYVLPIQAREVFVRDDDCFNVDWVETINETPRQFDHPTARLTTGMNGISHEMLSDYLDRHINGGFENFVDQHFEGTRFLTEMLKTAYHYYQRTKLPIIRKALKLVLAYNLTLHVTMVEGPHDDGSQSGKIDDPTSKYNGKTLAPVMINFQVKHALATTWRELQKDVLEELSSLYSSVYSGEKLKNWPTIFMLASILLAVWEEIQFDSHYRVPEPETVRKFCDEMESTPVGVIVGLFSAISQKLPAFSEWDTRKHSQVFHENTAVCDAMSEIRDHVLKHEDYLKSRPDAKFDRNDFDSLSNKFTSKLVIRAN